MITLKQLGTWLIAWKPGTNLEVHFSEDGSGTSHQANIPIHRQLGIHDVHTSTGTVSNTECRQRSKVRDTYDGHNAGGRIACIRCCTLRPWDDTGVRRGVDNTVCVRKGAGCGLRVRVVRIDLC